MVRDEPFHRPLVQDVELGERGFNALNPHLHVVFLDGVYAESSASSASESVLSFRALPHLSTTDVADALQSRGPASWATCSVAGWCKWTRTC
ncbi:MAG: hypothetical protein ABI488_06105 [Polyangiaceae bacterium]